jgi:hypothetical protein
MPAGFMSCSDPVTTAVWLVSFGLIILSILH